MNIKYVVFWIPTIFYKELQQRNKKIPNEAEESLVVDKEKSASVNDGLAYPYYAKNDNGENIFVDKDKNIFVDLSDKSDYYYYVRFELCPSSNDIIIYSKIRTKNIKTSEDEEALFNTTLSEHGQRRNGFVQFKFDEDTVPENCRESFKLNLTNAIYHKIKEFWHEHECHTGKDSDLHPEISDEPFNLELGDNPVLLELLEDFSKLFCKNAENVSGLNKRTDELVEMYDYIRKKADELSIENRQKLDKLHEDVFNWTRKTEEVCENSSIEYTYCKTLLSSIYNKSFKYDITLDALNTNTKEFEEKNAYRRQALNIRNAVRYIENIKYKNQNRQYKLLRISGEEIIDITTKVDHALKNSDKLQWMGLALAIYGVLSALLFGLKGTINIIEKYFSASLIIISVILFLFLFSFLIFDIPKQTSYCRNKTKK